MPTPINLFASIAADYDAAGELHTHVAEQLALRLPKLSVPNPRILEIGCGTGFLTQRLRNHFGDSATYCITDVLEGMVTACRKKFNNAAHMQFCVMDGEHIQYPEEHFDVIASSMSFHWFAQPEKSLLEMKKYLKPGGSIEYAVMGQSNFREWRDHLRAEGLEYGMPDLPLHYPGETETRFEQRDYGSGMEFLEMLASTDASTPKPGFKPLELGELLDAVETFDGKVTWHIAYGSLTNG